MVDDLLGKNGVARITLVLTNFRANPTYEEAEKEAQHEQLLRELWQGPMDCNSAIAKYDGGLETALRIISDFNSRDRQRPWLAQDQQCQMYPIHQKPTKPALDPDNDFVLSDLPIRALQGSTSLHVGRLALDVLITLIKTIWMCLSQLIVLMSIITEWTPHLQLSKPMTNSCFGLEMFLFGILLLCPGIFCVGMSCAEGVTTAAGVAPERPWKSSLPLQIWKLFAIAGSVSGFIATPFEPELWPVSLSTGVLTGLQVLVMWEGEWGVGWIHSFHPFSNTSQALALGAWLVQLVRFGLRWKDPTEPQPNWAYSLWVLVVACTTVLALYGPSEA